MQSKFTLLGGAALGAVLALGVVASADAKVVKHKHHAVVAAVVADDGKLAALTSEVETLESRLEAETQARQAMEGQVQAAQSQAASAQADASAAHQQLAEQIQTIPGVVSTAVAANKPKANWSDNTKVSATVFTDLSNISQSPSPSAKNGTGFDVKRAYLAVDHTFNDIYSANLTLDFAPGDNSFTNGGTIVGAETIKYAYVQAKFDDALVLQAGSAKTPWIPFVEDIYAYRYIDKVFIDQNKFGNSADWGVNAHGDFGHGLIDYSVSAIDGAGYKTPDRSTEMDIEGRVNINYMGFVAAVGGYTGKESKDINGVVGPFHNATREDALLAYTNSMFRVGVEYLNTTDWAVTKIDKSEGYSAFGSFNFTPQWSVFGRYDSLDPSKHLAPSEKYTYYNLGIAYEPIKIVDIALAYKHESITGAASGGYTDATTVLAPSSNGVTKTSGHYDEVGVFTQFKF